MKNKIHNLILIVGTLMVASIILFGIATIVEAAYCSNLGGILRHNHCMRVTNINIIY